MKMLFTKVTLAGSVALATLIAANAASAQTQRNPATPAVCPPGFVVDTQGSGEIGGTGPCVKAQPNDVIVGEDEVGRDPDPFIRNQLRRESESGRD